VLRWHLQSSEGKGFLRYASYFGRLQSVLNDWIDVILDQKDDKLDTNPRFENTQGYKFCQVEKQ